MAQHPNPLRQKLPDMCGIIYFTLSNAPRFDQARDQIGQRQKIHHAKQRPALAHDRLQIGRDDVRPLSRHRAEAILVDTQQEPRPVAVVPLADADELPSAERVKWVGDAHKTLACVRSVCSSN